MKITITRDGGFTGVTMPPKVLETLDQDLIDCARYVVNNESNMFSKKQFADSLEYTISVEEDGKSKSIIAYDNDDKNFRALISKVFK